MSRPYPFLINQRAMGDLVAILVFVVIVAAYIWFKEVFSGLVHRGVDEASKAIQGGRPSRWTIIPGGVPGETLHIGLIEAMSGWGDLARGLEVNLIRRGDVTSIECSVTNHELSDAARAETLRLARAIDPGCQLRSR